MKKEIREVWFKNHRADYIKINDDLKILEWKNPDSMHMNVRYVLDKKNIYISGDLYSAIVRLNEQANLENLGKYNLYYFSKLIIAMEEDKCYFDSDRAIKELNEKFEDWYDINMDSDVDDGDFRYKYMLEMLIDGANDCCCEGDWLDFVKINYNEICDIDDDCGEWIFNVGMTTSSYIQAYLIGLQMAYEQVYGEKYKGFI